MKKISHTGLLLVNRHMEDEARPLEKALYDYYFDHGDSHRVIIELKKFQNIDGGFGNGLEPDFWMKESSPLATSIGLKYLRLVEHTDEGKTMIKKAIAYLEKSYNEQRKGWFAVSSLVNNYPHAPWWEFKEDINMTLIDQDWGNPSAEIIGYLYRYKKYVKKLDVNELVDYALYHYNHESKLKSEHEVYCYIRLYNNLDQKNKIKLEDKLTKAIHGLINPDIDQWTTYVPMPLNFIELDSEFLFNIKVNDLNRNLDYFLEQLEERKHIIPVWRWSDYEAEWEEAKVQWTGILTFDIMTKLQKFKRI